MPINLPTSLTLFREKSPPEESFYRKPLPETATDLNSVKGKKIFRSALSQGNAEAFFPLIGQYQTQAHPAFCGLTSLCVVLNTLQIDPQRVWLLPWRWFMEPMLSCCFDLEKVKTYGVTVDQVARSGRLHGADVRVFRCLSLDEARNLIIQSVRGCNDGSFEYLIASYDREALGQTGTGHFSPLAAYDDVTDSVLILDVARFKYGPHWVSLKDLVYATSLPDPDVGIPRGILAVRKETGEKVIESHNSVRYERPCSGTSSVLCRALKRQSLLTGVALVAIFLVGYYYLYR